MNEPTATLEELQATVSALNARLVKGSDVLFAREQTGQTDTTYRAWLKTWTALLLDYEKSYPLMEAMQTPEQQALV